MKAHVSGVIFRLAAFVLVGHQWNTADDGLYCHIIDLHLQFLDVHTHSC